MRASDPESGTRRTAIVSGGGTGIGRAIAVALAADGLRVILIGRRRTVLEAAVADIRAQHDADRAHCFAADLTQPNQAQRSVEFVVDHCGGRVDAVVNNAGGSSRIAGREFDDVAAVWNDEWQRNVMTAVLLTTAAMPRLRASADSRVISISSVAALSGGGPYGAAKSALHAWTYTLARELGGRGTANVVAPGYVAGTEFFGDRMTDERHHGLVTATMVGRPATTSGVASAVRWLTSPEARDVTGQVIQVNGGTVLGRG